MKDASLDFKNLNLSKEILENLTSLGYVQMTPIQHKGLPFILGNQDFIGQANTGSGKTAAFALGILTKLDLSNSNPQALVIVPTRELTEQVAGEIRRLARFTNNVKVLTVTGGLAEHHKSKSLKQGAHIIVGTTGRILKYLQTGALVMSDIKVLVLDEADRLLEMGSLEEINRIAALTPIDRQTMLFSATFPHGIKELSATLLEDPVQITIDSQHQLSTVQQIFIPTTPEEKNDALLRVLAHYKPESCLVFCNSKTDCNKVVKALASKRIESLPINSDLLQQDRTLTLIKFENRSCSILVATDIASRGLDVKNVSLVINYDLPSNSELYVHRIGRTGRAGLNGMAVSFYAHRERTLLTQIGEYLKMECTQTPLDQFEKFKSVTFCPAMATMYISGGRKNNIRPGDILGSLIKEAQLVKEDVGKIHVLEVNSYVAISQSKVDHAIERLSAGKIKGKKFKVGKA